MTFDGSGSADDRTPAEDLTYAWDFGDGGSADGQVAHHTYAAPGTYEAELTVTDGGGLSDTDTVTITVSAGADLVVTKIATIENTGNPSGKGKQPKEGDKVIVRATITNQGTAGGRSFLHAVQAGWQCDGWQPGGDRIDPGRRIGQRRPQLGYAGREGLARHHASAPTRHQRLRNGDEDNNTATLTVEVKGNKVANGDFEQANAAGTGPEAWSGQSTGAGTTSWSSSGGADGSHAAAASGNGKSVVLFGVPTWTSAPIAVTPGQVLSLRVSVSTNGTSSAPAAGLAYLGPAGELLSTVRLIDAPLLTNGFTTLEKLVTLPPGVAQVRVVLFGFAPTDTRTAGTVLFDNVGLYAE